MQVHCLCSLNDFPASSSSFFKFPSISQQNLIWSTIWVKDLFSFVCLLCFVYFLFLNLELISQQGFRITVLSEFMPVMDFPWLCLHSLLVFAALWCRWTPHSTAPQFSCVLQTIFSAFLIYLFFQNSSKRSPLWEFFLELHYLVSVRWEWTFLVFAHIIENLPRAFYDFSKKKNF